VPTTVHARSTSGPGEPFEATTIERRDLGPKDVLIDIAYAGICHSDIHTGRGEWGETLFPLTPGHEIAGTVAEVGSEVTKHSVGDRVGVGCMVDSCRECSECTAGREQNCQKGNVGTYKAIGKDGRPTEGGYSEKIVVDEDFVLRIPEGIDLDVAAPLLCAGITLYSPLRFWGAGEGKQVAVVGMGGLGHMGVKIAHAMGAEVTVLSQSLKKQEDGLRLGADHYVATGDEGALESLKSTFDLIVTTISADVDIKPYLAALKPEGVLCTVGLPSKPFEVPAGALIMGRKSLAGSNIGSIAETQEMLDFCAEHHIGAEVEVISGDQIDEAWERVVNSDVRYRFVIDTSTLAPSA